MPNHDQIPKARLKGDRMMNQSEQRAIPRALAIALLIAIALPGSYALKMTINYKLGPSPKAAAKLMVFQGEKERYGIEYQLASETWDGNGNVTYVFEAIDHEERRIIVQPEFYPFFEVEFAPAGFIYTYGPGWDYEVIERPQP